MSLAEIRTVEGTAVVVPGDDIDTDRIIPARYLKCVTFDGLGAHAFQDERFDETGASKGHPIDDPRRKGATILVSGGNFGCGSSREHAPRSIYHHGFRAVIALSFAEIFFGNATSLGLVCVTLEPAPWRRLTSIVEGSPEAIVSVDVAGATISVGDEVLSGSLPEGVRAAFLEGQWDPLARLLDSDDEISRIAASRPPAPSVSG